MLIGLYKTDRPFGLFFLPVLIGLLQIPYWLNPDAFHATGDMSVAGSMPLYHFLEFSLGGIPYALPVFFIVVVFLEALILNRIIIDTSIFQKNNWLPALVFTLFMFNHPILMPLHPAIPANLFLIFSIRKTVFLYRNENALFPVFDSGVLIGTASLFYFPASVFMIWVFISLIIFRTFNWREWVVLPAGFLIPHLFNWSYHYLTGSTHAFTGVSEVLPGFGQFRSAYPVSSWCYFSFFILLTLISVFRMLAVRRRLSIRQRKIIISGIWFIITGGLTAAFHLEYPVIFAMIAIVLAAFFTQMFFEFSRVTGEIIILAMIGAISVIQYNRVYGFLNF
ncbi:MAG: hypothetical protein HYY40_06345 [Bacteroidetes bacterium]|nr:hypothetical protein [Bacteroidota bacterium]